jgi:hypothetical protein
MRITFDSSSVAEQWRKNWDGAADRFGQAVATATNMIASMIQDEARADIKSAGRFGDDWTSALTVQADGPGKITLTLDHEGADLFQEGGTVEGSPLLWLPISGTDAEGIRAADYPGQLFSVNSAKSTHPLLFSMTDKAPKYFGIEAVTIPKKFHLEEVAARVMASFRDVLDDQLKK